MSMSIDSNLGHILGNRVVDNIKAAKHDHKVQINQDPAIPHDTKFATLLSDAITKMDPTQLKPSVDKIV